MIGSIWYSSNSVFEAITADWEAYPIGEGWESALENISWFPTNTIFYRIDDICEALLFVTKNPVELEKKELDPWSHYYYHISIWHRDIIELHERGYIKAIKPVTDYRHELIRYNKIISSMGVIVEDDDKWRFPDGSLRLGMSKPSKLDYDNSDKTWAYLPNDYFVLTKKGISAINKPMQDFDINNEMLARIKPLIRIKYYDSAVREASILLELKLKRINKTDLFGQKLVDLHYDNLCKKFGSTDSYLKYYRGLLRCSVNFIRNEYAHDFPITSENRAKRLIKLYSKIYDLTDELQNESPLLTNSGKDL